MARRNLSALLSINTVGGARIVKGTDKNIEAMSANRELDEIQQRRAAEQTCGNCYLWETEDGGAPYCIMKDLYTYTERDHVCDEYDIKGNKYFTKDNRQKQ